MRGPTPPSSGVIALRSVRAWTSGERSPLRTPLSEAVPASMITTPGRTIESTISPGMPVAEMIISYWLSFVKSEPRWKMSTI